MKYYFTTVFFLLSFLFVLKSQPEIKFDHTDHDFGEVLENTYPTTVFKFYNIGNQPLQLTNVKSSCGCTAPTWSRDPIAPGDSGEIEVVFNSRGYTNRDFAKSVIVSYNKDNGGTEKAEVLYIHGKVVTKEKIIPQYPLSFSSYIVDFGKALHGKKVILHVSIQNQGDSTVQITEVNTACTNCFEISGLPLAIPPHQTLTLPLIYLTKSSNPHTVMEKVAFKTSLNEIYLKDFHEKGLTVLGEVLDKSTYKKHLKSSKNFKSQSM